MFKIVNNERLSDNMFRVTFEAPLVARKAQPGQFLMFRVDEFGERMPITISSYDREAGTVSVIMQRVGSTTALLASKKAGDYVADVVGPLGNPAEFDNMHKVVVVGGGSGCAIAWPQAKEAHRLGCDVDIIAGFRTKGIVVLEDEMRACCDHLYMMTDDGTYGEKGFTTVKLKELLEKAKAEGQQYDHCICIGPLPMATMVDMNCIMIDGSGMCGGCRLTVDGKMKFTCVDGPEFDGHLVDFDEAIARSKIYEAQEQKVFERRHHYCNLQAMADAEEAAQDAFIQYHISKKEFDSEEHIRAWLIRVTINKAKNAAKSFWRRNRTSLEDQLTTLSFESEEASQVFEAVMQLAPKYRIVVHLFYYEDYSVREIAEILKISEANVKTRLSRARAMLRDTLKEVWSDDE